MGPQFLREDFESWPIRRDFKTEKLEGEIAPKVHVAVLITMESNDVFLKLLDRVSSTKKLFRIVAYVRRWIPAGSSEVGSMVSNGQSATGLENARKTCIRLAQREVELDMQQSVSSLDGGKVHGKYRRLSPFLDEDGMWRVGLRMREFTPFTWDNKPAAFLPSSSRLTLLLMTEAHEKKHSGVEETVAQFRMLGY